MAESRGRPAPTPPSCNGQPTCPKFQAIDRSSTAPDIQLADEIWHTILESHCTFPSEIFGGVMMNLVKNPNVTSSHLFRADILYDSGEVAEHDHALDRRSQLLFQQMKAEYRPRPASIEGFELRRTMVRQLIPRNPQLDRPLVQTCLFFQRLDENETKTAVLYIPHVDSAEHMPFYHPDVKALAFLHTWHEDERSSSISLSYTPFPGTPPTTKLSRTALKLLQTVHKHGQGQHAGYEKRVHLDQILPQKRYQDTYTRLKTKYGRTLSEQWVEVTDPGKHVFEDLGIAAFLIELWRDMYAVPASACPTGSPSSRPEAQHADKPAFPGFVDIGCGNGLLVSILIAEGYDGYGFDARIRKSWSVFTPAVQACLSQKLLVPAPLLPTTKAESETHRDPAWDTGLFLPRGRFIISNHADELTPWTPLLAYLNDSAFLAIPCCSHDLAGARSRAPVGVKGEKKEIKEQRRQQNSAICNSTPQQPDLTSTSTHSLSASTQSPTHLPIKHDPNPTPSSQHSELPDHQSAQLTPPIPCSPISSSTQPTNPTTLPTPKKMPSAYASLCSYIHSLTAAVGFTPEVDVLRIPSTRNHCIVGRQRPAIARNGRAPQERESGEQRGGHDDNRYDEHDHDEEHDEGGKEVENSNDQDGEEDAAEKMQRVVALVERELGRTIDEIGAAWIGRAEGLARKPKSGH